MGNIFTAFLHITTLLCAIGRREITLHRASRDVRSIIKPLELTSINFILLTLLIGISPEHKIHIVQKTYKEK